MNSNDNQDTRVILAYLPVVHAGVIDWFKKEATSLKFILGKEFIAEFPQLKHDLRVVDPESISKMLWSIGFETKVLDRGVLDHLKDRGANFILPLDEVMVQFAGRYLIGSKYEYQQVFIRYDKINTTSEQDFNPDLLISVDQFAREVLRDCDKRAQLSSDFWRQVGAAVVKDGEVLLYGVNRYRPTDYSPYIDGDIRQCFTWGEKLEICGPIHAETMIVAQAAKQGVALADTDFYCTTLPCPGCARTLGESGIARLFYSTGYSICDAFEILKHYGVTVIKVQ